MEKPEDLKALLLGRDVLAAELAAAQVKAVRSGPSRSKEWLDAERKRTRLYAIEAEVRKKEEHSGQV